MSTRPLLPKSDQPLDSYESRFNRAVDRELSKIRNEISQVGWEDVLADISTRPLPAGGNNPAWSTFRNGIYAYAFSASVLQEVFVNFHVTHNWRQGSKFYPHLHWALAVAGTGGQVVRWGIEYTAAIGHNQGAFPATSTFYLEPTVSTTQYQHMITEADDTQAITVPEVDSIVLMRIFRDGANGADTCTDPAFLFFVDCHYQVDRFLGTPNKAPQFY